MNGSFRPAARLLAAVVGLLLVGSVALSAQIASSSSSSSTSTPPPSLPIGQTLEFLENKGQVRDDQGRPVESVRFTAQSNSTKLFFMPDRIAHVFIKIEGPAATASKGTVIRSEDVDRTVAHYHRLDMELVGANKSVNIRPDGLLPGITNFFTASVGPEGITGVRSFSTLVYENVYPNIDLVLKSQGKGIKAEFIVRPGGDPSLIQMRYHNAERVESTPHGGYRVVTSLGTVTEDAPYSYLRTNQGEQEIAVRFRVQGDIVAFDVPAYDRSQTLVIDPSRDWSTFHGGNGNDQIMSVTTQRSFNPSATDRYIYVCGFTSGGTFPLVSQSQGTFGGAPFDAFIAAYRYNGSRHYSTYFGGSADDRAYDITADANGNVWVVGQTRSAWWGSTGVNVNNLFGTMFDGFIARFNNSGTPQQMRYVGAAGVNDFDDYLYAVAYDGSSDIVVGGASASNGIATAGTWRTNINNATLAGLVGKLSATNLGSVTWFTYYGAQNARVTIVWGVDFRGTTGDVWIGGATTCTQGSGEIHTAGSFNTVYNNDGSFSTGNPNNEDGFVALLSSNGVNRLAGTYYGAVDNDRVMDIAQDPFSNTHVVAVGRTTSTNTAANLIANNTGVFMSQLNNGNNTVNSDGFVVRLTYNAGPGTLTRDWGSYWGSTEDDYLNSVAIDDNNVSAVGANSSDNGTGGKIFVAGTTSGANTNFPGGYNFMSGFTGNQGGYDVVWSQITRTTPTTVERIAIYGTSVNDEAWGIAVDNQRNVFIAGTAAGGGLGGNMTTTGAAQTSHGGGAYDGFLTKWCNLIVPNAPEYSTDGGTTWTATNVCQNLNSSATGFVLTSSPTYPQLPNNTDWTTGGSCPNSAVQTLRVRLTNAVQGVQYRLFETTTSTPLTHTSPSQYTIISGATTTGAANNQTIVATADGTIVIQITDPTIFSTPGTLTFRWDAFTQTVGSSCNENGVTSNLTVLGAPANAAIQQTAVFTDNANSTSPPGGTYNFYVCRGSTANTFTYSGGLGATSFNWCVGRYTSHRNPTLTISGAATSTLSLTISDGADTPYGDTLYLRLRLSNANGCAIEYQAALFVLPENDIAADTSDATSSPGVNPATLCVDNSGNIISPTPPVPYHDANYHHTSNPYSPWLGTDVPAPLTPTYTWSTSVTNVGAASLSTTTGPTTTLTGFASGPTSNPANLTLTLNEDYLGSGCSRNTTYTVNLYPQPTATISASTTNICETGTVIFTITINPTAVTSGSFVGNLSVTNQITPTITSLSGTSSFTQSGLTFSGNFNNSTIQLQVTSTAVTAAYDNQGTIVLNITSLTNGSLAGCTNTTTFSSPTVNVTQLPDLNDVVTGTFNPGGNPTNPTMTETNMPPAPGVTLDPATETPNSPPAPNIGATQVSACHYEGTTHYGQQYWYALPEGNTVANADDSYDWQFSLPAGLSVQVFEVGSNTLLGTLTGPTTFASLLGAPFTPGTPPLSEYRGIYVRWNNPTSTPLTATIRLIQTNNQAPTTCQTTMTDLPVVVYPLPTISQYTWQGASGGSMQDVCQNNTITLTISGLGNNQDVQLYAITLGSSNNVSTYTNPTTLPIATTGPTATFTINSGAITPTVLANAAYQEIQLVFATVDNNNCGSVGHVSPILRVWYLPQPTIAGPANTCPAKLTNPNALVNATTGALQVLGNAAPVPFPGPATYSISNLLSFPSNPPGPGPGTQFVWQVFQGLTLLTAGTDYDVTYNSSLGYSNDQASFSFGKHLAGSTLTIQVTAVLNTPGVCSPGSTVGTFSVTIDPIPAPDIAFNTINNGGDANAIQSLPTAEGGGGGLCSGQTAIYAAEPGNSAYIWAIDPDGALNNSPAWPTPPSIVGANNLQTVTVNWPAFSDVAERWPRLEVKVQNGFGCVEADTQTVYILLVPDGNITRLRAPQGPCVYNGEDSHIEAFAFVPNPLPPGFTVTNITWSLVNGLGAVYSYTSSGSSWLSPGVNDTVRFQFYSTGTEIVQATVTSTGGCSMTFTYGPFTIYPPPTPQIFGPTSVCHNSTHQYQVTPYISGDSYYWDITPSDPNNVIASPNSHITNITWGGNPNTTYTLRMIQVSAQGCSARVQIGVTVNPNPTPSINGPSTICAGQQYTYTTQDNSPNNSYAWSFTANTAGASFVSGANTAAATITTTSTGSFTIRVDETVTATSCTGFATKNVTVLASPTPSISRVSPSGPIGQACVGQTVTYQTAASGNNYQWSVTSGGTISGASTNNSVNIQWTATGTQTITLVETIPGSGCSTTVQQQVNVIPQPTPTISGPSAPCSGTDFSYTYQTANNAGSTYSWSLGTGVNAIGPTTNSSVTVYFSNSTANTVNRTLQVTETNSANCSVSSSVLNVTVTSTPQPVITGTNTACPGQSVNYSLTGTSILPPATTYNWSVTGGTITSANTNDNVDILWTTAGSQTITLVAANGACSKTVTYNVTVNAGPTVYNVGTTTPTACSNVSNNVTITLSGSQTGVTYTINRSPGGVQGTLTGTGNPLSFTQSVATAGTYQYTITANNGTCTSTMNGTATVVVTNPPTPSVGGPSPVCANGSTATYSVTPVNGGSTYTWSVTGSGNTVVSQTGNQATIQWNTAGTQTVSVTETDVNGCVGTGSLSVTVSAPPTVYNVTPANASICLPNSGTTNFTVNLSGSQTGVNYQIMHGSNPLGSAVAGTGSAITLTITVGPGGNIVSTGTYNLTVRATATSGGCANIPITMNGSVNLVVNPTPSPVVNGPTTVCSGQSYTYFTTQNSGSVYNWTVPSGWTITSGQGSYTITVTSGTSGGNITVTETVSSTGCSATSPAVAVSVVATPNPTISGSTTPCAGSTQTYTTASGFTSYSWSISPATAGTIQSGGTTNSATIQWGTNAVSATVSVTVANGACVGTGSLAVNVQAAPTVYNVGTTTPTACSNVSNNVTITLSGSQTGVTYTINRSPGGAQGTLSGTGSPLTFTQTVNTAGTYAYTITATNGAGCTSTMNGTATVVVNTPPTASISSGPTAVCSGTTATYAATPASGVTYAWSVSGTGNSVQSTTANQATILFGMTSGTATVTVVVTDGNGCTGTASQSVTVNALPLDRPVSISPSSICATGGVGSNVTSATVTVGSNTQPVQANTTYQLLLSGNVVSSTTTGATPGNTVTFTVGSLSAGTYVYSVRAISTTTPACTTVMTQTASLTVNPLPTPAVNGPTSPCQGVAVTYQTANNTGSTYSWTTSGAAFSLSGPTNTYQLNGTWTGTGSATVTVTETNAAGCGQTHTLNVTVTPAPTPVITASQANPICGGATVTFTTTPPGATSYTWTVGANGTLVSGQGSQSIVTTWANTGSSYSSSVTVVVNVSGCTGTATYTVNVNPQATPNITGPTAICHGQSGTYTTPLTTGRTYTWNMLATPPGMSFTSQSGVNLNSITVNWVNTSGSPFVAKLEVVESATGVCTGRDTIDVTVNPLPNTAITGPTSVCQNQTVTYSHSPALTGHSFAWTVTNAASWSGQGTGAITVTWGNTNGTVALTVTNNSTGCSATATNSPLSVTVNPNPSPTISGNATPCAGSTQTYSTQTGMTSYQWSITPASAGTILGSSTSSSVTIQWSNTAQPAQLTVQVNNSGCVGSQTINIDIKPKPTPAISGASQTCPSVDQTFTTPYTAGNSYSWTISYTPGYTITAGSLTSNTVTVRFNSPGASSQTATLTVTETSPFGCQGTATQTVTVQPAPTPVISGNTNVCGYLAQYDGMPINNTETYVVSDANGINYATANIVWTLPFGGGTFTGASSGTGVTTVTVQWDEPTAAATVGRQIAVQVTLGPPTNCSGQTTRNVQVNWNPKPSISGPRQWCDNSPYSANSTVNVSQSGLATYSVQVPVTPVLPSGSNRTYNWTITPASAGSIVSGQGTPSVQVSWTSNLANTPVNAVLSVTETINYVNTSATPTNKFCGITDTFNVVINPIPKPVITSPNNGITGPNGIGPCGRTQYTYQVAADANSTYQWVVSGGTIVGASTNNSVVVQWNDVTAPTSGYVGVTQRFQSPATMCSTYVQQNVTIRVRPTPVITGPTVLCQQTTNGTNIGTYTIQTVIPGRTYQWSATPASLVIATSVSGSQGQTFTVTWGGNSSTPLQAQVTVIETDPASGCNDQFTLNVTLNPNPTPVITSTTGGLNPNGVCAGSTHIYATQFNAGNSYLWTVTGGTISGANTNNQVTVVWGSAGTGTISVREQVGAMFGSGCWTQVTANVTIQPLPNPVIQGPATVCRYTQQSYTVAVPNVNNTYQWAITNGQILSGGSSPTVTVLWWGTPSGTISVTETTPPSQGSCSNTATLNVTINPKPTPVISGPPAPPVCVNSTQTYSTPLNTGNTYQWTVSGGTIVGVATSNTVNVTWTTVGNGTISVKETNALGCDTTVSRTIPVNALPSVTITPSGPTVICNGQSVTLLATPGYVSYSWNTGETTPNIVVTQTGTYTVTVVDQNGCSNTSASVTVTVQNVPAPQIQASGPTTFCQGGSVTLSVTGTNIQGYAWSNGATTSSITVTTSGSYWCEVTYNNGCKARTEIINVTVVPRPSVSITANGPTTFCEGGSVVLDAGAGFATYAWSDGQQTVGNNRTLTVTQSGSYTVTVTNNIGCSATSQPVTVTVYPKPAPQVQASGPTEFCEGGSVTLDAGAGYASYSWSNGATTRTITVTQQGSYTVTVTDQNNCSGSSQPVVVTVYPRPAKPTITQTGGTLTSSTAAQYQWYFNGQPISGATERSYTLIRGRDQSGYYKVRIRDNNGCENVSDSIYIDITPVEIAGDDTSIRFVPNPTSGELRIIFGDGTTVENARVVVRNLVGRDMIMLDLGSVSGGTTKTLDLSNLPNGVYLIEVTLSDGRITIGRVTKVD